MQGLRIVLALSGCVLLTACGAARGAVSPTAGAAAPSSAFRGDALGRPQHLSPKDLATTFTTEAPGGSPRRVTLAQAQALRPITLLYFGYTHCPDECPTTMADLGIALLHSSAQVQREVQVVFVTSDPVRDTPAVLSSWLHHFDPGLPVPFLGLTGEVAATDAIATSVGVPIAPPVMLPGGGEDVEHGTQVLAFQHQSAGLVWLADTSPDDYAHDLALLSTHA